MIIMILGELFPAPVAATGAPFTPGVAPPRAAHDLVSPDAEQRRTMYQNNRAHGKGKGSVSGVSTLALSEAVSPKSVDGIVDGEAETIPGIPPSFEDTPKTPHNPADTALDSVATPTPARTEPARTLKMAPPPTIPKDPAPVSIYESGMYWKLLDVILKIVRYMFHVYLISI